MRCLRQAFHLEPPVGWMNDPNGLCYHNNKYHVYFQYSPSSPNGNGEKLWGHYESTDFYNWIFTGAPLLPDTVHDKDGVYSGSAVSDGDIMRIYYTGNVKHSGNYDYILAGREANVIGVTTVDGRKMSDKRLMLTNIDYPKLCSCHVRDPKVWKDDKWNMVLGARSKDGDGFAMLYESDNATNWTHIKNLTSNNHFGYMWECPDIFTLDSKKIFSFSPQGLKHEEFRFQNVYQSGWVDFDNDEVDTTHFTEWDMGFDFYAPQTFETKDGRRVLIAWMGLPDIDYNNSTVKDGWQHCLTFPRELLYENGTIYQHPVKELYEHTKKSVKIFSGETINTHFPFILEASTVGNFSIEMSNGPYVLFDKAAEIFTLGFNNNSGCGRTVRKVKSTDCTDITMLVDSTSLEVFINNGKTVLSTRFYPDSDSTNLTIHGTDAKISKIIPMEVDNLEA